MFVIGEVREFSTGTMHAVFPPGSNGGSGGVEVMVERRVWTGREWAKLDSPDGMAAGRVFVTVNPR